MPNTVPRDPIEDAIDESLEESFPASDSPAVSPIEHHHGHADEGVARSTDRDG